MVELPRYDWQKDFRDVALRQRVDVDSSLLLSLRRMLDEIEKDSSIFHSSMSALEVMWQLRTHKCNQAEIPQAIFRVGDRLASVIYLELVSCWEVKLDGDERQFDTFEEVLGFIEQCRREPVGLA